MTSAQPTDRAPATNLLDLVPELRTDFLHRRLADESVVWSPIAPEPVALDPISTVMLDVIDGEASVRDLALDVHEEVGIDLETAQQQVARVVDLFGRAGLLTSSTSAFDAATEIARRELFISVPTPCSENASRLGTVSHNLRFGEHTIRVACDSRRGARKLRSALGEHIVGSDGDAPLGFVLTAPQGLKRNHVLTDRSGIALSEARGLDSGLHALACHLTALLPPAPGTVRIRSRALVSGDRTIMCLYPLLFFPVMPEAELVRSGLSMIDRLAADVDVGTGKIVNPDVPWPGLAELETAPGHAGTGGSRTATAVILTGAAYGSRTPTPARAVAEIAANGLNGSMGDLLDAAVRLVQHAELRTAIPGTDELTDALAELRDPGA